MYSNFRYEISWGIESCPIVVSFEQTDWQDACLGLGGPEESCAQVVVPGFRVVLEVNGQQYEIRTDQTGEVIRQVTDQ
jgi:hypothetical protein